MYRVKEKLLFQAGEKALEMIRDGGLKADDIDVITGAAGGPKWLVLGSLDRAVFGEFFRGRKRPLFMLGSSIGSWRFAAAARRDLLTALDRFEEAYLKQSFSASPSAREVTTVSRGVLDSYMDEEGVEEVLNHPYLRLNILTDRSRGLLKSGSDPVLLSGLAMTAAVNMVSRKGLSFFFERTLLHDDRDRPPFFDMDNFPAVKVRLTAANLKQAVMASGSIPLAMMGIEDISGAQQGVYRDGGMIDYHMDIPFNSGGLVLYPHYYHRVVPGWFDKSLPWRKPSAANMSRVIMVSPSPEFVSSLPMGRIPDRNDFKYFAGDDEGRIACWSAVLDMCSRMGEEFLEAVNSGSIKKRVRAL